jgi:hypothetical protein
MAIESRLFVVGMADAANGTAGMAPAVLAELAAPLAPLKPLRRRSSARLTPTGPRLVWPAKIKNKKTIKTFEGEIF